MLSESQVKWDLRFLEMSDFISKWSKDPSTQTGAILVRPDRTVCSVGYNGFPRGMRDDVPLYAEREVKYSRVIHCEMNAVLSAREPVVGYTLYTTGPNCDRCAVHMIQAGIQRFVFWAPLPEQVKRWNVNRTLGYFLEAGSIVHQYDKTTLKHERIACLSNMPVVNLDG